MSASPTNHFERFGLPPKPWLNQEVLQQRFLELSAQLHPDKAAPNDKFQAENEFRALNESFNILRHSRSRILHLLELSGLPKQEHVQNVPAAALAFFSEVASATRQADALIREKSAAASPMLKVQIMEKSLEQVEVLQHLLANLRAAVAQIESHLQALVFPTQPPDHATLSALAEQAAALGFFDRWQAQLHERVAALTF